MSFWSKLLKKNRAPDNSVNEALKQYENTVDTVTQRISDLKAKIEREIHTARRLATTNRQGALQALKRKEAYQTQLEQAESMLFNVEAQKLNLEIVDASQRAVDAMKIGDVALKKAQKNMNAAKIHTVVDSVMNDREKTQEISFALANAAGGSAEDDAELSAELEEMLIEEKNSQLAFPDIPSNAPSSAKTAAKLLAKNK